ncbi:MAG: hypothetical protein A3A51_00145 [Candidatus Levybacteria bacterium RIFCSPLOWO2_01_FULL_39_10]|nr:MAG: hypothetical protein A3A51_00145 [Candidatus Levybacteria bacterium RIFCSPLOWO2_01_FULL_39_10]
MLKSIAFANAATIVIAIFFIACALLSYVAPNLVAGIGNSWVHSLNLEAIKIKTQLSLGTLVYGLVTISVVTWVTSYAFVELYNRLAKK